MTNPSKQGVRLKYATCRVIMTLAFLLNLTVSDVAADQDVQKRFVTIGTGGPTGVYFIAGHAICHSLHASAAEGRAEHNNAANGHGLRCGAVSSPGSSYNLAQVGSERFHFGIVQSDVLLGASKSVDGGDRTKPEYRALFSIHREPYHLVAASNANIRSWSDLKGKRFNIGNLGSGQRATTNLLMQRHGLKERDLALATELTSSEQATALCEGRIDAFGFVVGAPNNSIAQAIEHCDARLVSLKGSEVQKLIDDPGYSFDRIEIPADMYGQSPVVTFGGYATVVTLESTDSKIVRALLEAVFERLDVFKKFHPAFSRLNPRRMANRGLGATLHPEALKYFNEIGLRQLVQ